MTSVKSPQPWLILTLRRTGGTSLTAFLSATSPFPSKEHEPFNPDRELGDITRAHHSAQPHEHWKALIRPRLGEGVNIKHCVEVVPHGITRALIDVCHEMGYRFMVLTRQNEAKRLMSLLLAQSTGAWGPEQASRIYPKIVSGEATPTPIDLAAIPGRVSRDFGSLGFTLAVLRNRNIHFDWYLFEELYFGEVPLEVLAREIARGHGVLIGEDDRRLRAFASGKGQSSSNIEPLVPHAAAARALLDELCQV